MDDTEANNSSGSTPWVWEMRKIERRPAGPRSAPRRGTFKALSRRDQRSPITMVVRYRGGPECWWQVEARGKTYRIPGHWALHDAMRMIWEEARWPSS